MSHLLHIPPEGCHKPAGHDIRPRCGIQTGQKDATNPDGYGYPTDLWQHPGGKGCHKRPGYSVCPRCGIPYRTRDRHPEPITRLPFAPRGALRNASAAMRSRRSGSPAAIEVSSADAESRPGIRFRPSLAVEVGIPAAGIAARRRAQTSSTGTGRSPLEAVEGEELAGARSRCRPTQFGDGAWRTGLAAPAGVLSGVRSRL